MKHRITIIAVAMGLLLTMGMASAANIAIIESQSANPSFTQDAIWQSVAQGLGHTATIEDQTFLDDAANIPDTDLLIISSAVIQIPIDRRYMIYEYIRSGVPVYLQCEYDENFDSNEFLSQLINATGGFFQWTQSRFNPLTPMQISGDLATVYNTVYSLDVYVHGCAALTGNNVVANMEFDGEEFGWFFDPPNNMLGALATNTDRNWILHGESPELMENYIVMLLNDSTVRPSITATLTSANQIPASGGTFSVDVQIFNGTNSILNTDIWTQAVIPNGNTFGPLLNYTNLTFLVDYDSPIIPVTVTIGPAAPAGHYRYQFAMGTLERNAIYSIGEFEFDKLGPEGTDAISHNDVSIDFGSEHSSLVASADVESATLPGSFTLGDPYPNPFNPSTSISIALTESAALQMTVYDLQGREVASLANGTYSAGTHSFSFDASGLASGVYFLQARAGGDVQTRKLVLMQ